MNTHSRRSERILLEWADVSMVAWLPSCEDFKCLHCRRPVSATTALSGVVNRNHCPYCLHSRHLDLYRAGDRLAACKEDMRPIGLSLKRIFKKYGPGRGELMLVHQCTGCGKLSLNRLAADDDVGRVMEIFEASFGLGTSLCTLLAEEGILLLGADDRAGVEQQLFGVSVCALTA